MMNNNLTNVIELTKKKLSLTFFKIVKSSDKYEIKEYTGPIKTIHEMMLNGWNIHAYLVKYIDEDYPIFNIFDFKSNDGLIIEKKSDVDFMTEELNEYIQFFKRNPKLFNSIKSMKEFLQQFGISNFGKYKNFSSLQNDFIMLLNNVSNNTDKQKFNSFFLNLLNDIYMNLEVVNVFHPRLFFENKFIYLISLIK